MKSLTVKQKLIGMSVIFVLMIAILSFYFVNRFTAMADIYQKIPIERVPQEQVSNFMVQVLINCRLNINELYGVERDVDNFETFSKRAMEKLNQYILLEKALLKGSSALGESIKGLEGVVIPPCRTGGVIESRTMEASEHFAKYKQLCERIIEGKKKALNLTNSIGWYDTSEVSSGVLKRVVELGRKLEELATDPQARLSVAEMRIEEKNIITRSDLRYINRLKAAYQNFNTISQDVLKNTGQEYYRELESIFDQFITLKQLNDMLKDLVRKDLRDQQKNLDDAVNAIRDRAHEQMVNYAEEAVAMEKTSKLSIIIIAIVIICIAILFGWFVSNGVSKSLSKVVEVLNEGSEQIAAASSQVSSASQFLAEGSSEQAASIEETSSSLEEISSMAKQNAENSRQADSLMKETGRIVHQADEAMTELIHSMSDISNASEETSKIIKTIDEIAFQTNLLALNAAVEAARAGEAGAGFAVVADEVRNLAIRAADAAKNTSNLIEDTVAKINDGSSLVRKTNDAFKQVADSSEKIGSIVGEIAAASDEQDKGIDQVNQAVAQMETVTQQNASNAEETASASEEMNAQAEQIKNIVNELVTMIGGKKRGNTISSYNTSWEVYGNSTNKHTPAKAVKHVPDYKMASTDHEAIADSCDPDF